MVKSSTVRKMTIKEFQETRQSQAIESVLKDFNGGSFMYCHTAFFEATGVWIPELVPIFQRLDAGMAFKALPSEVR